MAVGGCHVAVELFVGDHLLGGAYLQRDHGGPSTSRHDGSGEFLSAGDKLGAFLRRSLRERSTLKSPECGRSGPERPIIGRTAVCAGDVRKKNKRYMPYTGPHTFVWHTWKNSERYQVQPFSQKSRTPTVVKEFQIGLYDPAEADLELFCNSWSAGFLGERLYMSSGTASADVLGWTSFILYAPPSDFSPIAA